MIMEISLWMYPSRLSSRRALASTFNWTRVLEKPPAGRLVRIVFFNNQQEARARSISLPEGRRIKEDLERAGFKVFPMVADSFANGGEFLTVFGNSHMREFRHSRSRIRTKTMERGQAWTSGATLASGDYEHLLVKAVDNGFGRIAITFHGILGPDLDIRPHVKYPIKGTFSGEKCVEIIRRINEFNRPGESELARDLMRSLILT